MVELAVATSAFADAMSTGFRLGSHDPRCILQRAVAKLTFGRKAQTGIAAPWPALHARKLCRTPATGSLKRHRSRPARGKGRRVQVRAQTVEPVLRKLDALSVPFDPHLLRHLPHGIARGGRHILARGHNAA